MKHGPLRSFRLKNFKAVRDSKLIKLTPLTAFIGNNGSGKSSLVEGLETFRDIVLDGLDPAMRRWRGFEHVWNKAVNHKLQQKNDFRPYQSNPMAFDIDWRFLGKALRMKQEITLGEGGNELFIHDEHNAMKRDGRSERWSRDNHGRVFFEGTRKTPVENESAKLETLEPGNSMLKQFAWESFERWQFLTLNPDNMGQPSPQQRASGSVRLAKDGSNVAEYLNEIRELDLMSFEGILDSLRFVLPYADDLQPSLTSELERAFYLNLKEESFEVPGWLLSTGTLRLVAILACLRHPEPPPLLVIEEIENGLDPRSVHLIVEEIRAAIEAGTTQVLITTHSPYLLDLLDLSHIVVVERVNGEPRFIRPDTKQLENWADSFSPGRLYTMGRLKGGE